MSMRPGCIVECCGQRDFDRCVTEFQGFAALCDDDLFFWYVELLGGLRRDWGADDGGAGLPGDRPNVRNMIEMCVLDEDSFCL